MKKSNTQPIGEVIEQYIKALKIGNKMKEARILTQWDKIVGKTIAKTTSDIYIRNKTLYIHLNSSVVRSELFMIRQGIIDKINNLAEQKIINDIVLK